MTRPLRVLRTLVLGMVAAGSAHAHTAWHATSELLGFEGPIDAGLPAGWSTDTPSDIRVDRTVVHGGRQSIAIERHPGTGDFSGIATRMPADFTGRTIELRGHVRTAGVVGYAGLFLREDGDAKPLAFVDTRRTPVTGTSDWTELSIVLPLDRWDLRRVEVGAFLFGSGTAWADDLQLFVDGVAIQDVPKAERPPLPLAADHEFDAGSRIVATSLTDAQVDALTLLGQVWGFLKYHDRRVASGGKHWDYELFRIVPPLLAAPDAAAARAVLVSWIDGLGPREACKRCATLDRDGLQTAPSLAWIHDERRLGAALSARLQATHRDRPDDDRQFHVSQAPFVGNPSFDHEPDYPDSSLDDAGYRLIAVFRFWNIVAWWSPYRELLDDDWDAVLHDAIPRVVLAPDAASYQRELMALTAKVRDTHTNLWSSLGTRPPTGACRVPVNLRFIDRGHLVVASYASEDGSSSGLAIGDRVVAIDGVSIDALIAARSPYYAASNDVVRLRDLAGAMTNGECRPVMLVVEDATGARTIAVERRPSRGMRMATGHDLPGPTFRLLSNDVAYLKLSSIRIADVAAHLATAAGTRGLIVDIRDYPSEFVPLVLGGHLVDRATPFVRFTRSDPANPGAFHWSEPLALEPIGPRYAGKVVVLVDEWSISQSEFTAMALRAAGAIVVGSTTAGADGNVSTIPLPHRLSALLSGIGIFYPDRRPTQRIGIVPDVQAHPTVAGLRAGRDEVLEAGIAQIVGVAAAATLVDASSEAMKRVVSP